MTVRIAVIGGGIVGACISRVLSRYEDLEIHLIEREVDVGWGSTKANTSLIHAGYDDDPDKYPVRASFCAWGNRLWRRWVDELEIRSNWPGDLVLAYTDEDIEMLKTLLRRAERNHVPEVHILWNREEIRRLEPNVNPEVRAALYAPSGGQVWHPVSATIAVVENAVENGVRLHLETEVRGIEVRNGEISAVDTNRGRIEVDWVINAAGLYADEISQMAGIDEFKIVPRRGEYYIFSRDAYPKVRRILFPAPKPWTKGVVVTTTVDGHLMIGPNAEDLPEEEKEMRETTVEGLEYVWNEASKLVEKLPPRRGIIRSFAGMRIEPKPKPDFIVKAYDEVLGFINAAGMRSPGFTSAPAIAEYIAKLLRDRDVKLVRKKKWNPFRRDIRSFREAGWNERERLIENNSLYGRIICQCELVTEAEILEAIRRGATTLDGVKFRTRAMSGDCQGSFCLHRIAEILSRELNIPLWKVRKSGAGSEIGVGNVAILVGDENEES